MGSPDDDPACLVSSSGEWETDKEWFSGASYTYRNLAPILSKDVRDVCAKTLFTGPNVVTTPQKMIDQMAKCWKNANGEWKWEVGKKHLSPPAQSLAKTFTHPVAP